MDTSVLVSHWRHCAGGSLTGKSRDDASAWGRKLVSLHDTDAILTPIFIEFVSGARSGKELQMAKAYLAALRIIDGGRILSEDWLDAQRRAERVPRNGKPRHLGDCLIAAIAKRLRYDVQTHDTGFPTR
ncbi:MAG TPA: PIN domain-containing protein [Pirellulales bacterium]|nr:PIN domain-containing protein [Pirellulales bacterium]